MDNYLSNAFSLQMLTNGNVNVNIVEIDGKQIPFDELISTVGHHDIIKIFGVEVNRINTRLEEEDIMYVSQYCGGRLLERCINIPEGAIKKFFKVNVIYN